MRIFAVIVLLLIAACGETEVAELPSPSEATREAVGHYCQMIVLDHPGPKGQIHLQGNPAPIWFSSVRDTLAFTLLREEAKNIAAIYVNDMARAKNWEQPEPGTWIEVSKAHYVIGSSRRGGMGAPEPVPFGDKAAAEAFISQYGGHLVAYDAIPRDAVLGDPNEGNVADSHDHPKTAHERGTPDNAGHDMKHGSTQ